MSNEYSIGLADGSSAARALGVAESSAHTRKARFYTALRCFHCFPMLFRRGTKIVPTLESNQRIADTLSKATNIASPASLTPPLRRYPSPAHRRGVGGEDLCVGSRSSVHWHD